jgi:catechol 2,3-dioxygenase-like lactoylglutathione lyase family enzyme
MPTSSFAVQSIDHVVLTVASIQATVDFYTTHLGMTHETFVAGDGVER